MKLVQLYALSAGQKIGKMHVNERFYALPFEKYIIFAPFSKQSKCYSYWFEVLSSIGPILKSNGITIVQVGADKEESLPYCFHAHGTTNWGQLQYLISKSLLVLSTDTATAHLAGHYNKPLVDLISNNLKETVSPYFGDKSKQIILEPDRTNKNPSFTLDEGENKQIDEIKPELIAHSVLQLLGFDMEIQYSTLWIGREYKFRIIESLPDNPINISNLGIPNLIVRMDYNFNEPTLFQQLQHCKCAIVTDRPINPQILIGMRAQIPEIAYNLKESPAPDPSFCKFLFDHKIPFRLLSWMPEEKVNFSKLDFMDWGLIFQKKSGNLDCLKPQDIKEQRIYFKSNRLLLARGKIYQSLAMLPDDQPITDLSPTFQLVTESNLPDLLRDQDNLYFAKKNY